MVRIDDLSTQIVRQLTDYFSEVEDEVDNAKDIVTKEAVKELRNNSPKLTGDYSKGWSRKKVGKSIIVHNRTNYQLTHLLENGYAKVSGGRVPAKVHIRPVEQKSIELYERLVKKGVSG